MVELSYRSVREIIDPTHSSPATAVPTIRPTIALGPTFLQQGINEHRPELAHLDILFQGFDFSVFLAIVTVQYQQANDPSVTH